MWLAHQKKNQITLSFFSKLVKSIRFLPLNIKVNKSHTKVYTYYRIKALYFKDILLWYFSLLVIFLISFGMRSTTKLSKHVMLLTFTYKIFTYQDLLHTPHCSQYLVNYFINKYLWILGYFGNSFVFQNYPKDEMELKIPSSS